ncbi:MAG: Sec-independent protein translocase protein TatB [Rhodocyclaceae bacterium]|jgi:sec-independent protein translocase protein TatB|nr:Sec-independent protein translocase protein TatB [Rhodocyclaceae bacterium]
MFDLGFSEIVVIGVVALVVVGPERLPKVARTVGHLLGRAQRYVADVKSDIQREMQLEELQKLQEQVKQQARELESSVRAGVAGVENQIGTAAADLRQALPGQEATTQQPGASADVAAVPASSAKAEAAAPAEGGAQQR